MNQPAQAEQHTPKLLLVDASGFIFRAYHAMPPLTRKDGTPVGAVYGFIKMLMNLIATQHAEYIGVVFDVSRKTFRNELYPEYKTNRPPPPDDLIPQFALVREATQSLDLHVVEMENYEADDLIASYAATARAQGIEVVIVSSDKDLMQLICEGVSLYDPMKQKPIGEAEVKEKFGVTPDKVIEVQALIGDSVDHVPGVPSIGPKTAAELILQYDTLENLLDHLDEIKQPKRREALQQHADNARLSKQLVILKSDVPLSLPIDALAIKPIDNVKLATFLEAQNFTSLLKQLGQKPATLAERKESAPAPQIATAQQVAPTVLDTSRYELVRDETALKRWIEEATKQGKVAFDTETTSLDAMQAELVGFSLSLGDGRACYVPIAHQVEDGVAAPSQGSLFDAPAPTTTGWRKADGQIELTSASALLKPLLENPAVLKIGQNIKYDMLVLKRYGIAPSPVEDTMLLSYATAAGLHAHGMDELSQLHLGHAPIAFKEVVGSGKQQVTFDKVPMEKALAYAAEDADVTWRLWEVLKPVLLREQVVSVYEQIDRPLIPVLVAMESNGIRVDTSKLSGLSKEFDGLMQKYEQEVHQLAGHPFNIASPKQLGEVLFEEMGIAGGKKSAKTGAYGTGADVLEELAEAGHAMPAKVLEWRQLAKLKSTYTDSLQEQINPLTGRVHTSYAMAVASTGRLSSTDPNLQNIPIRTTEGKRIREAFIAADGCKLISADYSQIELRLLAAIADIETLKTAFRNGDDIHAITASQMFGVSLADVNSDLRRKAKTINFGIIYGISAHGLATRLGIGRQEAAEYIANYFLQYPGIRDYMETTKDYARQHGHVKTLYGRKVHLKEIASKNASLRQFSERAAINAPLQGTAADIMKFAMLDVYDALTQKHPNAKMLLQVHDELVVEAPEAEVHMVATLVQKRMQSAASLSVPLVVETGVGDNWGEIH